MFEFLESNCTLEKLKRKERLKELLENNLVSVVTPVYNGEEYISRLLDSILNQTYPFIEMILADDGSEDATREIAQNYIPKFEARGYSLKIISIPHQNASAAINAGLPYVQGQYLVWPDSDDELLPNSIALRVNFLKKHPKYQCVRSIMEYVSSQNTQVQSLRERLGDLEKEELFWDVLEGKSFVCCGCYMLKTEAFFKIYPQKKIPVYEVGQNFQMLLPILFQYKCPTIRQKLYRVYIRENSHSRQPYCEEEKEKRIICFEKLVDDVVSFCSIHNKADLCRIELWKKRRRAWIAYEYQHYLILMNHILSILILKIRYAFFKFFL